MGGLAAGNYNVYVYADGDNGSATRTAAYQISGTGITTTSVSLTDPANTNFSGTFTQGNNSAGNYVMFPITATGFTLTATPGTSTDPNTRAPVNAIQIVPQTPTSPDFSVTATPSTQTVVVGNATTYTTTIGALAGFDGVVTLSVNQGGLPDGVNAGFSPATVTGSGSATLTVTTTSGVTELGSATVIIAGTSGSLTHTTSVGLVVSAVPPPPDYTVTVTPGTQTVIVGNQTTYTTTVGALNGFGGVVTLGVSGLPAGATWSFAPATVTGSGSATLTVTTTSGTTPVGSSTLTITGTSGSLSHSATTTLAVVAAGAIGIKFVGQGTAMGSTEVAGVVAQSNWNDASGTSSTTPLPLINQAGASSGATVTWNTNGIWELPITDTPGNYRMMRGYLDTSGGVTTVTVGGLAAGNYNVYVYADGDNGSATRTAAYQISGTGITTTSVSLTDPANTNFSGTFTQGNNSAGNYVMFPITATGFTLTATPGTSTDPNTRAPVNAIQIVPQTPTSPDFSVTATPSTQTVVVGNATTYTTTIGALAGFNGVVTLSASGLPAGATWSFAPATVTGSGSATLTVTTTSGTTPVGSSTLTITGTSGSLTHTTSVGLVVSAVPPPPDYTVTVTPGTQTVIVGNQTTYTTTVGALNGFGGVVTLGVSGLPAGATWSFAPATVTGSGSATLTVTTTSGTTPVGSSTLTITGTSGSLSHSATTTLAVVAAGAIGIKFVGQGTAMGSTEVAGVVAQSNWNDASGTKSATPLALVNQAGASSGATVTWNTNGIWELPITDTPGNYRMMRGYLDTVGGVTTVTVGGLAAGNYNVYVYADGDNGSATRTAAYQISGTGITTTSVSLTDPANTNFSGTFTQGNNSAGNYVMFPITATGFTLTATPGTSTDPNTRAPVNAIQIVPQTPTSPDFSVTATPSTQTVVVGNATTYTTTIGALAGFNGVVTLSASGLPAGATWSFAPATVTGSGSATLTVTTTSGTTPVGSSTLTITGTSGSLTHTTSVGLVVSAVPPPPDYTVTVTPGTQTVIVGNQTTYTTTVGALNGFGGVVTLGVSGLPAGATWSFAPATVTGSGSATLTVTTTSGTTPVGSSTLTITGTSGSLSHSATTTLAVVAAGAIGIKFVGQGTAMGSTEVAGVVAQSNWNDASGTKSATPLALVNQAGASSGATVTWNTNGIWELPITDTPGNYRMMRGYLDTVGGVTTVTVGGLAAGNYNVYVYADGDNGSATRTAAYQISGTGITTTSVSLTDPANTNFSGTFTQGNNSAGNYVMFPITATGFTLTATPGTSTDANTRAPLNAIQIVPQ